MTLLDFPEGTAPSCKASGAFRREVGEDTAEISHPKPAPRACKGRGVRVSTPKSFR